MQMVQFGMCVEFRNNSKNIWGSSRENWAFVIFSISSIHFAVLLLPLKPCPSNLIHILQVHFTTVVYCCIIFVYFLGVLGRSLGGLGRSSGFKQPELLDLTGSRREMNDNFQTPQFCNRSLHFKQKGGKYSGCSVVNVLQI